MRSHRVVIGIELAHVQRLLNDEQMSVLVEQLLHLVLGEAVLSRAQLELELEHIVYVGELEHFALEHDVVETTLLA